MKNIINKYLTQYHWGNSFDRWGSNERTRIFNHLEDFYILEGKTHYDSGDASIGEFFILLVKPTKDSPKSIKLLKIIK